MKMIIRKGTPMQLVARYQTEAEGVPGHGELMLLDLATHRRLEMSTSHLEDSVSGMAKAIHEIVKHSGGAFGREDEG